MLHTICPVSEYQIEIQQIINTLKLMGAGQTPKELIYGRQKYFGYRDKPG